MGTSILLGLLMGVATLLPTSAAWAGEGGSVLYGASGARVAAFQLTQVSALGLTTLPEYTLTLTTEFGEVIHISYFTESSAQDALDAVRGGKSVDVSSCARETLADISYSSDGCQRWLTYVRSSADCDRGDGVSLLWADPADYRHEKINGTTRTETEYSCSPVARRR